MNNPPFTTLGLQKEDITTFSETFEKLQSKYEAEFVDDFNLDIDKFESLKGYDYLDIREMIKLEYDFSIALVEMSYSYAAPKGSPRTGHDYQAWGIAKLNNDFGHLFVKPERLIEKLVELFNPIELDFEDDMVFSRRFYVLAKDRLKATRHLNQSFRDILLQSNIKNLHVEIYGNTLIIGTFTRVNPNEILDLAAFIESASKIR